MAKTKAKNLEIQVKSGNPVKIRMKSGNMGEIHLEFK